ncbi:MAG: GNAT family N-acetyltransferase [Dehalococcoidia bacterium]|nr:GNAT family N-acetyltransferase [Dehalococcoidia bacterium]
MKPLNWVVRIIGGANWSVLEQAQAQPSEPLTLPVQVEIDGIELLLRRLEPGDEAAMLAFARALPAHDLLFLRRDITQPDQVALLVQAVEGGLSETVVVLRGAEIVGYANVASDGITWTRHVRELRVLVAESMRGHHLGRLLTEQAFAIARAQGAKKMIAQMTVDQQAAMAVFKRLGFVAEAKLRNQVMDREGQLHDLQIMSLDVDAFRARLEFALNATAMPRPESIG